MVPICDALKGYVVILDKAKKKYRREVSEDAHLTRTLSITLDQCSIGWSSMFFALEKRHMMLNLFNDPYHRDWNDCNMALGKCRM